MPPAPNQAPWTDAGSAARAYIARGYAPIPVPYMTKRAVHPGWPALRIFDPDVEACFPPAEQSNVGILLGAASNGLIDIDLDCREAITAAPFLLPPTGMVSGRLSSGGRTHWWYAVTDSAPKKASDDYSDPIRAADPDHRKNALLIELRSTGGQTVAPPSMYPADTEHPEPEQCVWRRGEFGEPTKLLIADLRSAVGAVAAAALLGRYWPKSRRHACALSLAGGLLRRWPVERVEAFVRAVCAAANDEEADLRVKDVHDTARRLAEKENVTGFPNLIKEFGPNGKVIMDAVGAWLAFPKNTKSGPTVTFGGAKASPTSPFTPLPEWCPFPTEFLPGALREFVATVSTAMRCDPTYVALPVLSVCAGMIGATRTLQLKKLWREPVITWTGVIGESGTLKTPPYKRAIAPVIALQTEHLRRHQQAAIEYRRELREYERNKKKAGAGDPGDPPIEPVAVRIYSRDTTIEALAGLLMNNRTRFLVGRDELSGWLASFNQYKAKGGSDLANWLELHGLGMLCVDRKTGEPKTIFVSGVGVSLCGGIQPGVLREALSAQHFSAGIPARLLFAWPPRRPKEWCEDDIDEAVEGRYTRLVRALAELEPGVDVEDEPCPVVLGMTPEAKDEWVRFYRRFARKQAAADGELAAAFSKLEGYAARLALLHHVCLSVDAGLDAQEAVSAESLRAGIGLAEWFAYEAARVYQMLGEGRSDTETRAFFDRVCRLAERSGGRVTARELRKSNGTKYRNTEAAEAALESLVSVGLGSWEDVPPGPTGGRPTRAFVPKIPPAETDETDETPDGSTNPDDESPRRGATLPQTRRRNLPAPLPTKLAQRTTHKGIVT